jgi:hypothetical protein
MRSRRCCRTPSPTTDRVRTRLFAVAAEDVAEILDPPGSCLYHYTRLSTALENILPEWLLRLNPFSKMRDPRESRRWGFEATGFKQYDHIDMDEDEDAEAMEELRRFMELQLKGEALKDHFKVLSLTRDDPRERDADSAIFGRGFAHPRLWEHYADNHRGVCLCFDYDGLHRALRHDLAPRGQLHCGPVVYVDADIAVEARQFLMDKTWGMAIDAALDAHVENHLAELFFTKLKDWETECEYRFVLKTNDTEPVPAAVTESLRAIIVGDDVSPSYIPALSALCDPVGVKILRIRWANARPWLQDPTAPGYS